MVLCNHLQLQFQGIQTPVLTSVLSDTQGVHIQIGKILLYIKLAEEPGLLAVFLRGLGLERKGWGRVRVSNWALSIEFMPCLRHKHWDIFQIQKLHTSVSIAKDQILYFSHYSCASSSLLNVWKSRVYLLWNFIWRCVTFVNAVERLLNNVRMCCILLCCIHLTKRSCVTLSF